VSAGCPGVARHKPPHPRRPVRGPVRGPAVSAVRRRRRARPTPPAAHTRCAGGL